jgi:hypothetical protein
MLEGSLKEGASESPSNEADVADGIGPEKRELEPAIHETGGTQPEKEVSGARTRRSRFHDFEHFVLNIS